MKPEGITRFIVKTLPVRALPALKRCHPNMEVAKTTKRVRFSCAEPSDLSPGASDSVPVVVDDDEGKCYEQTDEVALGKRLSAMRDGDRSVVIKETAGLVMGGAITSVALISFFLVHT